MKLEAARRLVTALAEGQSMDLQYVINTLADQGIPAKMPDSIPNSVVATESIAKVMQAFEVYHWEALGKSKVEGGIYCSGISVTMERLGQKICLMHTSPNKVIVWLP